MKDVLQLKKVSPALRLAIQTTRFGLSIKEPELTDEMFRSYLLDNPHHVVTLIQSLSPDNISHVSHEQLCNLMDDADYDATVAARESESGLFLDVHAMLTDLRRKLDEEHEANKWLYPATKFMVAVDGSRQSHLAFELVAYIRRQGRVAIVNVDDVLTDSCQLPQISCEFILEEYKAHIARLKLPSNRITIRSERDDAIAKKSSVAQKLLVVAVQERVDFVVLGAYGMGGPSITQVSHVPRDVLCSTASMPVLIVPPLPVNSMTCEQKVFVVAVDRSSVATRCINAALKLMRSVDTLRIVHFNENPITTGECNKEPFEWCKQIIKSAQINGQVDIQPITRRSTVSESLQNYISTHAATCLILGSHGEGAEKKAQSRKDLDPTLEHRIVDDYPFGCLASAMLFSPRCALCLCP